MRLVLVELSRFRSRRAIALMLLAAALLAGILAFTTAWDTRPVSAADKASAQAQIDQEVQSKGFQRELARCHKHPMRYMGEKDPSLCDQNMTPQLEWYLHREPLSLKQVGTDTGLAVLTIVAAIMIIVGSTFAGADWSSGSMSNQVLFEPRRWKVWLAKAGALFVGTLVASAVIVAAFWVALYLVAESRGIPTGAAVQADLRWMAGRGVLLAAVAALGGFGLTMLVRHTVGTLAVLFAYAAGGEALTASLPIAGVGKWSLSNNVFAWLRDGQRYWDDSLACPRGGMDCDKSALLSLDHAVVYLGITLLVVLLASVVSFRRRDIP